MMSEEKNTMIARANLPLEKGRREFIRTAAIGVAGVLLSGPVTTFAAKNGESLNWVDLGNGFGLIRGAGGNILLHQGSDGVLMIDGGKKEHAKEVLKFASAHCGGVEPSLLFNSHWHWDQIGCNAKLSRQGVEIIAHENTRLWLTTDIHSRWEADKVYPRQPKNMLPTKTFYWEEQQTKFNDQTINYGLLEQAHTDGDIYIEFAESNVIFVGDVVSGSGYPVLDYSSNGWLGGMVGALGLLLKKIKNDTKVIASTGQVLGRADVQAQFDMCDDVIRRMVQNYYAGGTYKDFLDTNPTQNYDPVWGNPDLFLRTAYASIEGHVAQVRGFLRR